MPETLVTRKNGKYTRTDRRIEQACRNGCGGIAIVYSTLKGTPLNRPSGVCRSCAAKVDIRGKKAHMLVALEETEPSKRGARRWRVRCDCGNETVMHQANFGRTKSCGCLRNTLPPGQAEHNKVLRGYKSNARHRGLVWSISDEEFDNLIRTQCHYCGDAPSNTAHWGKTNGPFVYNGIDRRENEIGYTIDNVVPCCKVCNFLKRTMSYRDFIALILKIGRHRLSSQAEFVTAALNS